MQISETKKTASMRFFLHLLVPKADSNRHVFLRLILNQLRLPISPLRHGRGCGNVLDYTCHRGLCKSLSCSPLLSDEKNSVIVNCCACLVNPAAYLLYATITKNRPLQANPPAKKSARSASRRRVRPGSTLPPALFHRRNWSAACVYSP